MTKFSVAKLPALKNPAADLVGKPFVNRRSLRDRLREYARHPLSFVMMILVMLSALATVGVVCWIVVYVIMQGAPNLTPELFELEYTVENKSLVPALFNTLIIAGMSLLIAVPIGVFAAIFMVEYTSSKNKFVAVVRMAAETLAGIPSIVYGIFGLLLFVEILFKGYSMLAGILTMSIMILPLVMRTTEEALKSVPASFREGSFALGAGKLRTVFRIVLPSALPGILSGVILALGRVVGETAALIYTAGTVTRVPDSLLGSGETLAVHMYVLASEGLYVEQSWATAIVLILLVLVINGVAEFIANRFKKEY